MIGPMMTVHTARFHVGQIVRHTGDAFHGVVVDVDAAYAGDAGETGAMTPDQPYYQVMALGEEGGFVAYVAEEVLERHAASLTPHEERRWFSVDDQGHHAPRTSRIH